MTALLLLTVIFMSPLRAEAGSGIALDVSEHFVYRNIEADVILQTFNTSAKVCRNVFDGAHYVVYGRLGSIGAGYTEFTITGVGEAADMSLKCTSDSALTELSGMTAGAAVKVYGTVEVGTFWGDTLELAADRVELSTSLTAPTSYYTMLDGSSINYNTMLERSIDGHMSYSIPSAWSKVESELPNVSGYQYKLNNLSGEGIAESVFVFYVDGSYLEDATDISKTGQVRKAIVKDILCNENLKMYSSVLPLFDRDITISTVKKTDYADFTYYTGNYQEQNGSKYRHRVEFAFIEGDDTDGVAVVLYVYNNAEHVNDVLFMMRTLKSGM